MDKIDYYKYMIANERALTYGTGKALITFFIGMPYDRQRFLDKEPWTIIDDDPDGTMCYVDQMITDKDDNNKHSYILWKLLIDHIRNKFVNVTTLTWNRYKGGKSHVRTKRIGIGNDNKR